MSAPERSKTGSCECQMNIKSFFLLGLDFLECFNCFCNMIKIYDAMAYGT